MAIVRTTVGQIIQDSVSMAQLDSGFYPLARGYYNRLLENYARVITWPFYNVTQADQNLIAGQKTYGLPEDFAKEGSLYLITPQSARAREIIIMEAYAFDQLDIGQNSSMPTLAKINLTDALLVLNNSPSSSDGYKYRFSYFRLPEAIDLEGGNDEDLPDFDDPQQLIESLTARLMKYVDDSRADKQEGTAAQGVREKRLNSYNNVDPKIQLASSAFVPGRRPTRGGGGFGGFGNT